MALNRLNILNRLNKISTIGGGVLKLNAPTLLTISADGSLLSWTSNSAGKEDGFQIYRQIDGGTYSLLGTVGTGVITYAPDQTAAGDSFNYEVRAYKGSHVSDFSNIVNFTWSSYWTTTPSFALPSTGMRLVVGQAVTIYGDSLVDVSMTNNYTVVFTCDIGSQTGNDYSITPVVGNIGDHSLKIDFKNKGHIYLTETITLSVYAKATGQSLNVLMIGDSTIAGREDNEGVPIDASLSGCTITYLGTQGSGTRKNEGYGGYRMKDFVDGISQPSKFVKTGVLNIPAYFTDNSIAVPDLVWIRLGINDVGYFTDVQILGYFDTFIAALLAYNKSLQIIVALPNTGTNDATKWASTDLPANHDPFTTRIHQFHKALTDHYAGCVYDARVDCSYEVYCLDRSLGYTNSVHQSGATGDTELAGGLVAYFSKAVDSPLNGLLSYWKLDEASGNAIDSCGLYNGVPDNVTQNVTAKIGKGVQFAGPTNGYVNMDVITPTLNSYAVSLWAKRGTFTDWLMTYIFGHYYQYGGLAMYETGTIYYLDHLANVLASWDAVWTDKTSYHHIVFIVTGTTAELIFDGVSKGVITHAVEPLYNFILGRDWKNGLFNDPSSFIGIEDEVALYKKTINVKQILALNNAGAGKSYPF